MAARVIDSTKGQEAMAELCRRYWYPLYAYVRGCGYSQEDSEDITQAFFVHILEGDLVSRADDSRGRFRWFLLGSLRNFLRNRILWETAIKRGGGTQRVTWESAEAEQRYMADQADLRAPDELFDLGWARSTLGAAFRRLADEFGASGRAALFEHLKQGLVEGQVAASYEEIARQLGVTVSAVKVSMHRLRHRFRDLVRAEVACSVADPAEVDDEFRHLVELLAK